MTNSELYLGDSGRGRSCFQWWLRVHGNLDMWRTGLVAALPSQVLLVPLLALHLLLALPLQVGLVLLAHHKANVLPR